MICTNTDHYVNTLSTIKKEKKRKKSWCNYDARWVLTLLRNLQMCIKYLKGFLVRKVNLRSIVT